ncbi:MAG: hypothetical protein SFV53_03060 [Rickettsiales bacterium]|nr:hypothetical protein [Rickettsiales bacterium]
MSKPEDSKKILEENPGRNPEQNPIVALLKEKMPENFDFYFNEKGDLVLRLAYSYDGVDAMNEIQSLPEIGQIVDFLQTIKNVDLVISFTEEVNEHLIKAAVNYLKQVAPNVKNVKLVNGNDSFIPKYVPDRYFDFFGFKHEINFTYEEGILVYLGGSVLSAEIIKNSAKEIAEKFKRFNPNNFKFKFKFNPVEGSDIIALTVGEGTTLSGDIIPNILFSLEDRAFFALVQDLHLYCSFSERFLTKGYLAFVFEELAQLFPSINKLGINQCLIIDQDNKIIDDYSFSQLERFRHLNSLSLPLTAVENFGFLNGLEISELTLSLPFNEYDPIRSAAKIVLLCSQVDDPKAKAVRTLNIFHTHLNRDIFFALLNKFNGVETLSISTSRNRSETIEGFPINLPNLKNLMINNLRPGELDLSNLSSLRLDDPDDLTLKNIIQILGSAQLTKLGINCSYDSECRRTNEVWKSFFGSLAQLHQLSDLSIIRETSGPMTQTHPGSEIYSSRSGGASTVEIDQQIVESLAATSLNKLVIIGFSADQELKPKICSKYMLLPSKLLELIQSTRENMEVPAATVAANSSQTERLRSGSVETRKMP